MPSEKRSIPISAPPSEDALRRLRLIVRTALMYHRRGMSQAQVAKHLGLSQARVSQLLQAAEQQGIVETVVHVPPGMYSDLEEALEQKFGAKEISVVDIGPAQDDRKKALGVSAAPLLREALVGAKVIGVAAWSETLHAAVEAMQPILAVPNRVVVNVFGGFGPSAQMYAQLMQQLARICSAHPLFLLGPGVVASASLRNALRRERQVREVASFYDRLSILVVGIGVLSRQQVLREAGYVSEEDQAELQAKGAVGDVALHFFDAEGRLVQSSLSQRVLGIGLEQLKRAPRVLAVAGGEHKIEAIRAALRGHWIDSLITDLATAQRLLTES